MIRRHRKYFLTNTRDASGHGWLDAARKKPGRSHPATPNQSLNRIFDQATEKPESISEVDRCFSYIPRLFPRHWFASTSAKQTLFITKRIFKPLSTIFFLVKHSVINKKISLLSFSKTQKKLQTPPLVPKPFQILKIYCRKSRACKH